MLIDFVINFADDSDDEEWNASYRSANELCILIVKMLELDDWETERDYINYN